VTAAPRIPPTETALDDVAGITFATVRGRRVMTVDYSGFTEPAQIRAVMDPATRWIEQQPPRSVRLAVVVRGTRYNVASAQAFKDSAVRCNPHTRAMAVVGLSGLQRVLHLTVTRLVGREIPPFETLAEAQAWLAAQE
jgi:hypothetical protein